MNSRQRVVAVRGLQIAGVAYAAMFIVGFTLTKHFQLLPNPLHDDFGQFLWGVFVLVVLFPTGLLASQVVRFWPVVAVICVVLAWRYIRAGRVIAPRVDAPESR